MRQGTQVRIKSAPESGQPSERPWSLQRRFRIAAIAFIGLAYAGGAWADSLALISGASQRGLGGSPSQLPLVVEARNIDGAVVAGRTINWSTGNGFVLSAASSVTDANGQASVNFTYGDYGTANIVATDTVGATSATALETSEGSDSITLISGDGQNGQAGLAAAQPIVVQVLNAAGNPVSGRAVNWTDTTAYTHVNAPTSTTGANGQASMGFSYLAGPPVISGTTASIQATNSIGGQSVTANVTELGTNYLQITSPLQNGGLIGQTSAPIVAHVTDWQGNPIAGANVTWTTPQSNIFNMSSTSTFTDANGNTSITAQYLNSTGDDIITADFNGVQVDVHFYIQSASHMDVLTPNPIIGSPNTASATPMMIQDFNKDGTPIAGQTVNWTVQSGDATVNAGSSVTDASGKASMGFNFGTTFSVILAQDTRGIGKGMSVNPSVTGVSLQLVSGSGQIGPALSAGTSPIVFKAVDQSGNPVPGRTINWSQGTQSFNGSVTFTSPTTTVTDANGLTQITFTYQGIGKTRILATDTGGPQNAAIVTAVGSDTINVVSGGSQSGLVGTHSAQPIVVVYSDASGAPSVGQTVNWMVKAGNAVLDSASSVTDASGQASMGFTYGPTASVNDIEASVTTVTSVSTHVLETGVGANALSLISGNGQSGLISTAGAQPLVVEVRDAAGNPVSGRTIFWSTSVPAGSAVADASSSVTDASGRASMAYTYGSSPGAWVLVANDAVTLQQVQFTVTAIKADNIGKIVSGDGQTGLPGTASAQPIVIELRDASNAPVAGLVVNWSVVSGPATLGSVTNTTDANGQAHANFNFGPTPGTSIIQANGPDPSKGLVQATVTALGNNQSLSIVSGDGQVLVGTTPSQPLVVQLKNFSNAPVVGATISWTATNGNLPVASSVTDANGRASNTVSATGSGAVTVQANSTLASAPVSFSLSTGLAHLSGLTPEEHAVAGAIDAACPALAGKSNLTPAEADLLAQCEALNAAAGLNGGATVNALDQLVSKTAAVQSNAAVTASVAQFQNINLRLTALRSSSRTSSLSGLSFAGPGGVMPLSSLMGALLGEGDKKAADQQAGAGFSRWGFFATGTIGRGTADARSTTPAYNYDINGLTAGVDYRQRDNWVYGVALGFSHQDTNLEHDRGDVSLTGWSISSYSTWSFKNNLYVDGVVTWGSNSFDMNRRIDYTLPMPGGGTTSIHQVASGKPGGDLFSGALTFGGDFHKQEWNFSPYAQVISSRMGFDAYQETLLAGPGNGLGLSVDARTVTTLSSVLGAKLSWTHSVDWGVFIPTASLEWQHEYKSDLQAITARFTNDPSQTAFTLSGTPMDNSFFRVGAGFSLVMPRGRSGFLLIEHMLGRQGMSQDNIGLGFRIEF